MNNLIEISNLNKSFNKLSNIKVLKKIQTEKKSVILNCGYGKGYSVKESS